jgi:hypothetical protein
MALNPAGYVTSKMADIGGGGPANVGRIQDLPGRLSV